MHRTVGWNRIFICSNILEFRGGEVSMQCSGGAAEGMHTDEEPRYPTCRHCSSTPAEVTVGVQNSEVSHLHSKEPKGISFCVAFAFRLDAIF